MQQAAWFCDKTLFLASSPLISVEKWVILARNTEARVADSSPSKLRPVYESNFFAPKDSSIKQCD